MKKIISLSLSLAMLAGGMQIVQAEEVSALDSLKACKDGAEIVTAIQNLDSAELLELGIDLTNFNKAQYPGYIGDALYDTIDLWTDEDAFSESFASVIDEYIPTKVYTPVAMSDSTYGRRYTNISTWDELKSIDTTYTQGKTAQNFMLKIWGTGATVPTNYFKSLYQYRIEKSDYITEADMSITISGWTGNNAKANVNIEVDGVKYENFETAGDVYSYAEQKIWTAFNANGNQLTAETEPGYKAAYEAFMAYDAVFTGIEGIEYSWSALNAETELLTKSYSLTEEQISTLFGGNGESDMILRTDANNSTQNVNVLHTPVTITLTYDNTIKAYEEEQEYNNLKDAIWNKVNVTDAQTLADNLENMSDEEIAVLGIDMTVYNKLAYPMYAARAVIETGYTNIDSFKNAFDTAVEGMIETSSVTLKCFDDTENYQVWKYNETSAPSETNTYKGREGLMVNWGTTAAPSTFYLDNEGHYMYLTFNQVENRAAVIDGTITLNVKEFTGNHIVYADKFSYSSIPGYTMADYVIKADSTDEQKEDVKAVKAVWTAYDELMTADTNPTQVTYTGESNSQAIMSVSAQVSETLISAIKQNNGNLTIRLSSDLANNTVVQASAVLNLVSDKTIAIAQQENQYAQLIAELNAIGEATGDEAVSAFISAYISEIAVVETAASRFDNLANSVRAEIMRDLAAKQLDEINSIRAEFNELVNAAKDVQYKYEIKSIDFANYNDATGHDVTGDGVDDAQLGAISSIKVEKKSNYHGDFVMVYAAYKGGALVNVMLVNSASAGARGAFYNALKAADEGAVVEDTWSFFTQYQPDEVKVFMLDSFTGMKPVAVWAEVENPQNK